jgi:hypothetical protein
MPMNPKQRELVIDEFLEGGTRADQWLEMRELLSARLKDAIADRDNAPEGSASRNSLEKKISELRDQVIALAEEEAITRFVEDSVRATISRPSHLTASEDEEDEIGYY